MGLFARYLRAALLIVLTNITSDALAQDFSRLFHLCENQGDLAACQRALQLPTDPQSRERLQRAMRAAQQRTKSHHLDALLNECRNGDLSACGRARQMPLSTHGLATVDRAYSDGVRRNEQLEQERARKAAEIAAANQRRDFEQWVRECSSGSVAACDFALNSSFASGVIRDRLLAARLSTLQAQRPAQASTPSSEANGVRELNAMLFGLVVALGVVVGVMAKANLPKSIKTAIAIAVPTLVSVVLLVLGYQTDFTIISIPIWAGLAIALVYSVVG